MFLWTALRRIVYIAYSSTTDFLYVAGLYVWDFVLVILNLIIPDYAHGKVISSGSPGAGGKWPAYVAPEAGASRSPCPGLNALANHGILPRDGKNIKFADLPAAIRKAYNMSHPFSILLPRQAAQLLNRDPASDSFDLSDLSVHNMIEHDASFCRKDIYYDPLQSTEDASAIDVLLSSGPQTLAAADLSNFLGKRRVECRKNNPQFSLSLGQKFIGSTNAAFILKVFGGVVADLRAFLGEERLPDGWEPRTRHRMGLTMTEINLKIAHVELGVKEEVDGTMSAPRGPLVTKASTAE
ncbi:Cloroperoxidase [Dichomitus squalens]|uniref:Cloroperoxidase n=1 Tax=Dichomitus squalens TaxID=114155 RepID=A0A4Q9PCZ0_9APHY|nr:Cloroperoxidase [Dichomitus squalens]